MLPHIGLGQLNKQVTDGVAYPAGTAVQHEPDPVGFIQAHLDEVVAAAQCTQVSRLLVLAAPGIYR